MNESSNNTAGGVTPSLSTRLGDLQDILATVRSFNEALFLAAGSIHCDDTRGALQSVSDAINDKLLFVRDGLDEIREELK